MNAEIKGLDCSELADADISTWQPKSPEEVHLAFTLSIGPVAEKGSDYFQIVVTTPEAIKQREQGSKRKVITNRKRSIKQRRPKMLVVQEYNWQRIKETLERMVAGCERLTWVQTVNCLRNHFDWEYEGMLDPKHL